jgi:hypothetical protein
MHMTGPSREELAQELNEELVKRFGLLLPSADLVKILGYGTPNAFHQAISRGTVPVPLMRLAGRRGRFALARDVAQWLSDQRLLAQQSVTAKAVRSESESDE